MQSSLFNISTNGTTGKMQIDAKYPEVPGYKEHTTSKDAAIRVKDKAEIVREKVRDLYKSGFVGTADDVNQRLYGLFLDAEELIQMKFTVRPRASELTKQGFLKVVGINDGKKILKWDK